MATKPKAVKGSNAILGGGSGGQSIVGYTPGFISPRAPGTLNGPSQQVPIAGNPYGGSYQGSSALEPDYGMYQGTQISPTYGGSTNFGALGQPGAGSGAVEVDEYGNQFVYQDYGGGRGEWLQKTPSGALVRPQDAAEQQAREPWTPTQGANIQGTRSAGNIGATPSNNFFTPAGGQRPVVMSPSAGLSGPQGSSALGGTGLNSPQQSYNDLLNDYIRSDNNWYAGQTQRNADYLGQMGGIVNGANSADLAALGKYNTIADQQMANIGAIQAPEWQNYASNPQDIARQNSSYDFLSGVSGGSLDYSAAQAQQQMADYQTYQATLADYQTATQTLAELHQYASDPEDIARQQDVVDKLKKDLESGSKDQREVMEKYKALSDPEVTAQERYLAEIARRSFESQDRSNREAVQQDLAMRGLRSGGAEIASNQSAQERLGQDRTLAELGLQANAIARAQQSMQGWQQGANAIRSSDQAALGMYGNMANAIRSADDQVGMFNTNEANENEMFNAGQANQISMFNADAYNSNQQFNANSQNQASQFNANAYNQNSMFNAGQGNQINMFNAGQQNQASANNQSTRLQGGISAGNMANAIRGQNDAVGMFNTQGSQTSKQFAAQLGVQKASTIAGIGNTQFQNTTGVTATNAARSGGLAQSQWSIPSATEEENRRLREEQINKRGILFAGAANGAAPSKSFPIPGVGV